MHDVLQHHAQPCDGHRLGPTFQPKLWPTFFIYEYNTTPPCSCRGINWDGIHRIIHIYTKDCEQKQ